MSEKHFMLVYTSKATELISQEMIYNILHTSNKYNSDHNITGFLAVRDGHFLQLLEGKEEDVHTCFERIKQDPRHHLIITQGEAFAENRLMPDWSMGLVDIEGSGNSAESLLEIFRIGRDGLSFGNPSELQLILKMFAKGAKIIDPNVTLRT